MKKAVVLVIQQPFHLQSGHLYSVTLTLDLQPGHLYSVTLTLNLLSMSDFSVVRQHAVPYVRHYFRIFPLSANTPSHTYGITFGFLSCQTTLETYSPSINIISDKSNIVNKNF